MQNKDNYVPLSSCLLRYAKSRPNGKLIVKSIINGPYVKRMIVEPGDPDRETPFAEAFHEQTDEEITEKEARQIEADDQAIQIILMGLPEDVYATVDNCQTAQETLLLISTDISKITRKPSKTGKHGHENERVNKSRKPKPEKVKSSVNSSQSWSTEVNQKRQNPKYSI
ncbi:hypothetical protein Tco_1454547 [Tanacetum coccineum]